MTEILGLTIYALSENGNLGAGLRKGPLFDEYFATQHRTCHLPHRLNHLEVHITTMTVPGSYSSAVKQTAQAMTTAWSTNNQGSLNDAAESKARSLKPKSSLSTLCETPAVHDLDGANIRLEINNVVIKTHEHLVSKLAYLNKLVQKARLVNPQSDTLTVVVTGGSELAPDFLHTFKILGASLVDSFSARWGTAY
ncbi:hypothetical protein ACGC1H_001338 [Rhizoctonia solani]